MEGFVCVLYGMFYMFSYELIIFRSFLEIDCRL